MNAPDPHAQDLPDLAGLARLDGATAVVTGGTGGIGLHTAAGLARLGARVVVTGRDARRGEAAVARIVGASGSTEVELLTGDLSTLDGARALADALAARYPVVHVLVNNAGSLPVAPTVTVDGVGLAWAVNHFAPFLLTASLLPALRAAATHDEPARVVEVTSSVTRFSRLDPDDVGADGGRGFGSGYGEAKLANLATVPAWVERLDRHSVVVHAADPGGADTVMTRAMIQSAPGPLRLLLALAGPSRRSSVTAARSSLVAAASPGLARTTGRFITPRGTVGKLPRRATDPATTRRLWELAATHTALDPAGLPQVPEAPRRTIPSST